MKQMAGEIVDEIMDHTFEQRLEWIESQRQKGNQLFKEEKFDAAIDEYMKVLVALDFSKLKRSNGNEVTEND